MRIASFLALALAAVLASAGPAAAAESAPALTNADVVTMVKAGLSDEVVVAKIRQAPAVDFRLEAQDLVALSREGASQNVIGAMLVRSGGPPAPNPGVPGGPPFRPARRAVTLLTSSGALSLSSYGASTSSTGFPPFELYYFNLKQPASAVRTNDRRPTIFVSSTTDPARDGYRVVRFDVDRRNNVRSVREVEGEPVKRWTVPYETARDADGWRINFREDLEPGEYGIYPSYGLFFDFGVD